MIKLLISCGLKKSVICTSVFELCSVSIGGKQRFLAGGLGIPVPIVVLGFLEVEGCT